MFLKRLELTGFKSFPDKIRLDFPPGITAVVGPNGSGKSNIADAVRWVMGEQSVKSLRGSRMEDVIFSGTEHRKPLGYAEVAMLLDNSSGTLPIEYSEVKITRRVYRSGESEFLLNGAACRLKDIHTLFMDTGVGREGYSIIGQGRVDEILSSRSEDRRQFFEEAAGIVKYKSRRNEAIAKLEAEKQNIARVEDIIEELQNQLVPLTEQAETAKKYLNLRDRYKIIHVNLFLIEAEKFEAQQQKNEDALKVLSHNAKIEEAKHAHAKEALAVLKESVLTAETDEKSANEEMLKLATAIEKAESDIKLTLIKQEHAEETSQRHKEEAQKLQTSLAALEAEEAAGLADCTKYRQSAAEAKSDFEQEQSRYSAFLLCVEEEEKSLAGIDEELNAQTEESANIRQLLAAKDATKTASAQRYDQLKSEITNTLSAIQKEEEMAKSLTLRLESLKGEEAEISESLKNLHREQEQNTAEGAALQKNLQDLQRKLSETKSRHKILTDMARLYEGYYASVKAVLLKAAQDAAFGAGIFGAAGELITMQAKYEQAISAALGSSAQTIVTATEKDAGAAIEFLKQFKQGRATFLPLSAMRVRTKTDEMAKVLAEEGVLGLASDFVAYNDQYHVLFSYLLGNIFVVDSFDNAVKLAKKYQHRHRITTLAGELLSPGGAISGGSAAKTTGIIGRGRQIEELSESITSLETRRQELEKNLAEQNTREEAHKERLNSAYAARQENTLRQKTLESRRGNTRSNLQNIQNTLAAQREEEAKILTLAAELDREIDELQKKAAVVESAIDTARRKQDESRTSRIERRIEQDQAREKLSSCEIALNTALQNLSAAEEKFSRTQREKTAAAETSALLQKERQTLAQEEAERKSSLEQLHKTLANLRTAAETQKETLDKNSSRKAELRDAVSRAESDERQHYEISARLKNEAERLQIRLEHDKAESLRLYNEIWELYELTYQTAQNFRDVSYSNSYLRQEEKRIKAEINALGDVNVGAVEACKNLKERYDLLVAQRDDILKAEESLKQIIQELSEKMQKQFTEQFALINRHFSDVFREMFGGGKAGLTIKDPDSVLKSGIDITAQPPGKNLQSLSLMSGGERALTAIALLFGILRMKPSPFCLLDEIEAALDDANVVRFANFLKRYGSDTQFVVITHRKGTMECADTLYGVTMQELGISTMVSVDFR